MVESISYFPYGQTRINTGTKDVHHKFTGQELDSETGETFPYMPISAVEVTTVSVRIEINSGTVSTGYNQYAEAYTSDAGTLTAKDEIAELTRLIYAEAAGEYEVDNAMEGIGWVVRNRVMTQGWPDTYYGVIHQKIQFSSVPPNCGNKCSLWNQAGNPQALSGRSLSAYYMALSVSAGVYNGVIAGPTGGALFYHSGTRESLPTKSVNFFKTLTQ